MTTAAKVLPYAATSWLLGVMFAARVLGQALQRWLPQPFLPPADAFQGSGTPYAILLAVQLAILATMFLVAFRLQTGELVANRRLGRALASAGSLYMTFSVLRIVVGMALPDASPWFRAWIPAFFHVVLAAFVLTVSLYHLRGGKNR